MNREGGLTRGGLPDEGQGRPANGVGNIPDSPGIDTIVIMPVNADRSFIYWEVTRKLIDGKLQESNAGSGRPRLMIKVFGADSRKELLSFTVENLTGRRYIDYHTSFQPLTAEIGILNGGAFISLLKSRTFPAVSPGISETGEDMWMRGIRDMYEIERAPLKETGKTHELFRFYEETAPLLENHLSSKRF